MAAQKMITGYDPASMQVVRMDTVQVEDVPPSEEEYLDDMVRIWRRRNKPKASKVTGADGQQQSAARSKHAPQGEASGAALKVVARKSQWRPQQTPRLGRDELIVVLKPRATLDLKASFAPGQAGVAVRSAIRDCGEVELSVWPVWEQNVLVCGLNSEEAARKLAGDVTLVVEGRQLPFRGHLKASGDICKGAIQVDPRETSPTLKQKLRWPHGDILSVRKLGGTDVAVVTFEGTKVPRQIFYSDQGTPVRLYKKTIPACHRCGTVGHRADICPRPQPGRCGQCGSQVATTPEGPTQHECTPCCLICGGSHLTGAAGCVGKYRKPIKPSTAPNNIKRATSSKQGPPTKVKDKKPPSTSPSKSGQAKPCVKSGTQAKSPHFTAGDFPPLDSVQHKDTESLESNYDPTPNTPAPSYKWLVWRALTQREYGQQTPVSHVDKFRLDCYGSRRMLERLELMYKMHAHDGCVNALHFNSTGTRLASGSDDLSVVIWDWATGEPVLKYDSGHRSNVFQAKFVPMTGDCYIVSCARDGLVRLAELSSTGVCKTTRRLAQHRATAHKLAIENDSPHTVLSCGEDAYVFGIDLRKSSPDKLVLVKENEKKVPLYTIFINPTNSNQFAVGGRDHYVRVYDRRFTREDCNPMKKFCPHHLMNCEVRASVSCLVYNYDGSEILASYNDEDIYIFNSNHSDGAEFIHRYKGHRNSQTVKGVNYMGLRSEYVVSGSDCGYVYLWDKESEHIIHSMHGDEEGVVNCLEPHPSCPILATSGLDEDVKIWVPSCETPPDMSDLKTRVCKNMKEREEERKREGHEAIDSQMLWYLMQQLHRSAQSRARGDRGGGADSSTDSDNSDDDDDMDTQHSVQCVQS